MAFCRGCLGRKSSGLKTTSKRFDALRMQEEEMGVVSANPHNHTRHLPTHQHAQYFLTSTITNTRTDALRRVTVQKMPARSHQKAPVLASIACFSLKFNNHNAWIVKSSWWPLIASDLRWFVCLRVAVWD